MTRRIETEGAAPVRPALELKIAISSTSAPEGSPIRLEGTWTNHSGRRLVVWGADDPYRWRYGFGGSWEAEFDGARPQALSQARVLGPDAKLEVRVVLDAHVRFRHAGGRVRRHLPPGTYDLIVSHVFVKHGSEDAFEGEVVSEPTRFSVKPRAGLLFERPQLNLGPGAAAAFQKERDHLAMLLTTVTAEPRVLPVIVHQVRRMIAMASVLDGTERELFDLANVGADAGAACFGGTSPEPGRREARIGRRKVSFTVPQWPTGGRDLLWLHTFELSAVSRNAEARGVLLNVAVTELCPSGAATPRLKYVEALRAVARGDDDARPAIAILAAVPGADARLAQIRARALGALVQEDLSSFDGALLELLELFREEQFQPDANIGPDALLCLEAITLAQLGDQKGLPVGIVSEFMPARLIKGAD